MSIAKIGMYDGNKNPNYGKHHSEETRRKISKAHTGTKMSEEIRNKISIANSGKIRSSETKNKISKARKGIFKGNKAPNWRGGLTEQKYCEKWTPKLREEIRERDNYICQHPDCLCTQLENMLLFGKRLLVHHVHYDKPNCEPDLITLCSRCSSKVNYNRDSWEQSFTEILQKRNLLIRKSLEENANIKIKN